MNWLTHLIRPDLRNMAAYSSARSEAEGFVPSIGLDANEFPWPPFGSFSSLCTLHRYPEPQPENLRQRLASVWGIDANQILIGRGSDEGIDVLLRLFCQAGTDHIIICPPTYGMYQVAAVTQGAGIVKVPLNDMWQLDMTILLKTCNAHSKLIFIPSPNAPLGHLIKAEDIRILCRARSEQSLIIIDEAYVEFTDNPRGMLDDLQKFPNLVILRTLSKAHALAGERVGTVLAAPDIIKALRKVQAPYPLTQSSIHAALDTLSPHGLIQNAERRALIISERERMALTLTQCSMITHVFPSVGNFLLVQTHDSKAFMQRLRQMGILPRDRHDIIPNTVRLTIGTPEENNLVLKALGIKDIPPAVELTPRLFSTQRVTKETRIHVTVNLDNPTFLAIDTGIGFFDHMLSQLASHGGFGLALSCKGDLVIDQHHSIEDCALALGEALKAALGDKRGVTRFGFSAPLDEALAHVVLDLSGRPYFVFTGQLPATTVGTMSSEMVPHFFRSLATALGAALHITIQGDNTHHMVEAMFKATGRALKQAFHREGHHIPSTKGVL